MLSAIALDDEIPALEVIETFANRTNLIELKACFSKTGEALEFLSKHPVDLIFLDINMPAMSGIEFAKSISEEILVIFTTSYSEFAVESYTLGAVDYLLKPFAYQRFIQALEKAQKIAEYRKSKTAEPIILKANYGLVKVMPEEILFIEGLDNYLKIHIQNKKPLVIRLTAKRNDQFITRKTVFKGTSVIYCCTRSNRLCSK